MRNVEQTAERVPYRSTPRRRIRIGYFLRHGGNLHYFAAIKPYLDRYLCRPDIENRLLVKTPAADIEREPDFQGYTHLFADGLEIGDCDLVLTPTFLRPADRAGVDRKRTLLVQVFHGMSDKPFTYERDFSEYDLCLCAGQRQLDRLLRYDHNKGIKSSLIGYPKFDGLSAVAAPALGERPTIIYSPTWRKGGISSIERFLESPSTIARLTQDYDLVVKPHPNVFNPDRPFFDRSIVDRLKALPNITLVRAGNVLPWFARAALFVGDISAAGYEWLFFRRPMVFLNPQPGVLKASSDVEAATYLWRCGEVCDDMTKLPDAIARNLKVDAYARHREETLRYSVHRPRDSRATARGVAQIDALLSAAQRTRVAGGV